MLVCLFQNVEVFTPWDGQIRTFTIEFCLDIVHTTSATLGFQQNPGQSNRVFGDSETIANSKANRTQLGEKVVLNYSQLKTNANDCIAKHFGTILVFLRFMRLPQNRRSEQITRDRQLARLAEITIIKSRRFLKTLTISERSIEALLTHDEPPDQVNSTICSGHNINDDSLSSNSSKCDRDDADVTTSVLKYSGVNFILMKDAAYRNMSVQRAMLECKQFLEGVEQ